MSQTRLDLKELRRQIIGIDTFIQTPFGERLMLYADYTASGRSLAFNQSGKDYALHTGEKGSFLYLP
jgi:hypothetical protein